MPGGNGNGPGKGGPEQWRADTVGLFSAASLEEVLPLSPRLLAFTFYLLATGSDKRFVPLRGNLVGVGGLVGSLCWSQEGKPMEGTRGEKEHAAEHKSC